MTVFKRIRRPLAAMEDFLCPIIGTCLTLKELHKIGRRFKYDGESTPYQLHTWLIRTCKNSPAVGKYLQKYLCEKYRSVMQRLDEFEGEALLSAWIAAVQEGQVAGAFWAILTRLDVPDAIIEEVFGEVHMMSHLQAAEVRTELKAFDSLRRENNQIIQKLQKTRSMLERQRAEKEELRRHLSQKEIELRQFRRQSAQMTKALQSYENTEALSVLKKENSMLQKENKTLRTQLTQEQALRNRAERRLENLREKIQNRPCRRCQISEPGSCPAKCPAALADDCPLGQGENCPRLCKKNILLVGGLEKLTPYYRGIIEGDFGGVFYRHDGDFRQGHSCLMSMVKKAHVVICPVGMSSHNACLCVKKLCKRLNKPCVMLAKPGLGALKQALTNMVEQEMFQSEVQGEILLQ
ncbi:DUF2325 domain-containing protein [Desulfobacca acetoxidans]